MRILMLAHRLPYPPTTGDRVRAFHVAQALAGRHQLTLACPLDGRRELAAVRELRTLVPDLECTVLGSLRRQASALAALAGGLPLSVRYFTSRALAGRIRQRAAAERFDVTYVSSSSMAQYAPPGVPLVMDFVDVDSEKFARYGRETQPPMRWIYRLEAERLRRYERAVAARARVSVFVTSAEAALFRTIAPDATTAVVPNGVNPEYFRPMWYRASGVPTIVFTGALDYFPNVDAVRYFSDAILPLIRRQVPRARFLIVGRRPHRLVRALRRPGSIEVAADVPDVRPYLAQGHVAVVPLRIARGIQNKVLEAMAMGLPVVALPGPAQGIEARIGAEWFVEDGPEAFAARVVHLLEAPTERMRVGRQARQLVEEQYAWRQILPRIETLVAAAARVEHEHHAVAAHGSIETNGDGARTPGVHHA